MNTTNFYGFICSNKNCNTTINVGSGDPICPMCGSQMIPNKNGTSVGVNVSCKKCGSIFGMIDSDKCPNCGTNFE